MSMTFTDENIHDIIATGQPVVVDFWATPSAAKENVGAMLSSLSDAEFTQKLGELETLLENRNTKAEWQSANTTPKTTPSSVPKTA